jgi:hypothetical protein
MICRIFVCCFVIFCSYFGSTQPANQADLNLQKYWYYRMRLTNDFVKVGEGRGHSIPIQSRQGYTGIHDIELADATIYHGYYLGVLATEFKLLNLNKRFADLEYTKTELYYAIKAFERLDAYGEEYLGMAAKIDGYFQRDDIACDFIDSVANPENYAHFNQGRHVHKAAEPVFKIFTSDDCPNGKTLVVKDVPKTTPSMSQDQLIWLLMGFMLIEKCVDGLHTVRLHSGEIIRYDFSEQAKRHVTNMLNYCKFKYPEKPEKERWRLFRPDGKKVFPGQNAFVFKYPMAIIGERMHTPIAENNQTFDRKRGKTQWNLTRYWVPYKNVNGPMISVLAALSGKWGKDEAHTMRIFQRIWKKRNWEHFYFPLMSVLHDFELTDVALFDRIFDDLSIAPAVGPYNLTRDEIGRYSDSLGIPQYTKGWTRHLKYCSLIQDQDNGDLDNYMRRGYYSGLDFMLVFNLFYLTSNDTLPVYQNLVNRHFSMADLPSNQHEYVTENGLMAGGFSTITIADSRILDSLSHIRAGDDFQLNRPQRSKPSPQLLMRIEPFNPWDEENFKRNNYGWEERFLRKVHKSPKD